MTVTYLLDTNMFSYIAKGVSPAARTEFQRLSKDRDAILCISVVTEAEVRYGMAKRALSRTRCAAIEGLFANVQILPWGSDEAIAYAQMRAKLEAQGFTVSAMDLLIAAQAIAAGAVLVAADKIFGKVAEVADLATTVNWATDIIPKEEATP
jgi:tRNA(fMet)-specific endonuclease VapC